MKPKQNEFETPEEKWDCDFIAKWVIIAKPRGKKINKEKI